MSSQSEFKDLIKNWEENQKKFETEKPQLVSKQSKVKDFFGVSVLKEEKSTIEDDSKYWSQVRELLEYYLRFDKNVQESSCKACDPKTYVDKMSNSSNPVRPQSIGKDSDFSDLSNGNIYNPFDLEKLIDLKNKLDKLLVKLNTEQVTGKNVSALEKRINNLTQSLDKLSESLGKSLVPSQQGD